MMQLLPLVALLPMLAADPQGFAVWKGSDLKGFEKTLASRLDDHRAAIGEFRKVGDYRASVVHREGDGEAELHEKETVILLIQSGDATLVAGGKLVDPRMAAPGEIRGASIQDGESTQLGEGDVALIPAYVPHRILVAAGKQVTYLIIRQPGQEMAREEAATIAPGKKPTLGIDLGSGFRSCVAGDNSPDGTVVDGYKKMTSRSFLGPSCLWASERPPDNGKGASAAGDQSKARPGADVGDGYRSCVPGDDSPGGTIVDGYRKVVTSSPFGTSCAWQRLQ